MGIFGKKKQEEQTEEVEQEETGETDSSFVIEYFGDETSACEDISYTEQEAKELFEKTKNALLEGKKFIEISDSEIVSIENLKRVFWQVN